MPLRTVDEISTDLDSKDREILTAMDNIDTVEKTKHDKKKEIVELTESIRQADHNLSRLRVERKVLERELFSSIRRAKVSV